MIRSMLERLSRGVVLRKRLPADLGGLSLIASPDASLRFWKRGLENIDTDLANAVRALVGPGDAVWDVGANVGIFTFASAGLAGPSGRVLAIEPDPWLAQLLRRSVAIGENAGHAVEVLPVALGDRVGIATLNIAMRGRAANFVSGFSPSTQAGGIRESVPVMCVTLDWLLEFRPAPAVLKIDVEGAEAAVLRGGAKLLREARPRILCEVAEGNRDEVTEILRLAGYLLYDASLPFEASARLAQCTWNTIALPGEARSRGAVGAPA